MANSGVARKKPFLLLATILAIVLLVLACITKQRACYTQQGYYNYESIDDGPEGDLNNDDCESQCNGLAATKFTRLNVIGQPSSLIQVVRCSWVEVTGRLFLASASLMCLWVFIELLLTARRKYYVVLNLMIIAVLALGSVAAAFMLDDIQDDGSCDVIDARNDVYTNGVRTINPDNTTNIIISPVATRERCYRSIFTVSFILQIVALVLFLAQFIYNLIIRKKMNEPRQEAGYVGVPHHSVPTDSHIPPPAVPTGGLVTGGPVTGSDNRIA